MARLSFVELMAAKASAGLPEGDEWEYEAKLDGYRGLLLRDEGGVQLLSRNDYDLTRNYPTIVRAATRMPVRRVALDGEIVALDKDGRPDFQALQHPSRAHLIAFYAFDVLHLDGRDIRKQTLEQRRSKLPHAVGDSGIRVSLELPDTAPNVVASIKAIGLEGVVAKLRTSPYDPALEDAWLKVRFDRHQEFVVGGYRGGRTSFDTIVVGYYEERGHSLRFAGKVRAGFTPYLRRMLFEQLKPLVTSKCPFTDLPSSKSGHWAGGITAEEMSSFAWVKPNVVVEVRFKQWTDEGRLRLPAYLGLRPDKAARDVHREEP